METPIQQVNTGLHISDFLPNTNIKVLKSGYELYLAYCLDRYASKLLHRNVTIEDLGVDKHLLRETYFNFIIGQRFMPNDMVMKAYNGIATKIDSAAMLKQIRNEHICVDDLSHMKPTSVEGDKWVFEVDNSSSEYSVFYSLEKKTALINLIAYLLVYNKAMGTNYKIVFATKQAMFDGLFVPIMVLQDYGNKLISHDFCELRYRVSYEYQPDFMAFVTYNRQRGYMRFDRLYTDAEKCKWASKKYPKGSVVLLYKHQNTNAKSSSRNPIVSCYPAVVKDITKDYIVLTCYPTVMTRLTQIKQTEANMRISRLYTEEDKYNFAYTTEHILWSNLGVDVLRNTEGMFILDVFDEDGTEQWLTDGVMQQKVWLSTPETVYAVFEDHNIPYNRKEFYERHFASKGIVPIYDQWKARAKAIAANNGGRLNS